MGALDRLDRDTFALASRTRLSRIESAAVLLCLDDGTPVEKAEASEGFWHGCGSAEGGGGLVRQVGEGANRFFDKSIQLIVTNNGKAGLLGEHSMMDGMPMLAYADAILSKTYAAVVAASKAASASSSSSSSSARRLSPPPPPPPPDVAVRPIFSADVAQSLRLSAVVDHAVSRSLASLSSVVSKQELSVLSFLAFGASFAKKEGFSPDALVQVAIQLATYRLYGEVSATYEATQVRQFKHGRTETTRGCSLESRAFVETMGPSPKGDETVDETRADKVEKLKSAVEAHVKYMAAAAKGQAIDRHLLGMRLLVEDEGKCPSMFKHPLYARAKTWRVSTSHLTHSKFDNWGWGEVEPDGVGIAYSIGDNRCTFNVTAMRDRKLARPLAHLLEEALLEIRDLLDLERMGKSKL